MPDKELIIDVISDPHTKHEGIKLPGGDILICAGDISFRGTIKEVMPFLEWFAAQKYQHLILIAGNHDWLFEQAHAIVEEECKRKHITLLNDSGTEIEGIKVYGSPVTPEFHAWAFNRERGEKIKKHWDAIPTDTELLITHGPPHKILDRTYHGEVVGCADLANKIEQTSVKLHVFGHIHEAAGHKYFNSRTYVNASSVDGRYILNNPGYTRVRRGIDGEYLVDIPVPRLFTE